MLDYDGTNRKSEMSRLRAEISLKIQINPKKFTTHSLILQTFKNPSQK